jgi:hypothetical protein
MFEGAFQRGHATYPDDGVGVAFIQEGLNKSGAFHDQHGVAE